MQLVIEVCLSVLVVLAAGAIVIAIVSCRIDAFL